MSEYIEVGQPLQFTDPNTPTRVGEIVENVSDIYNIPSPRLGMQVFVKSEKKSFVITSLKSKVIGGVDVPEAAVEAFESVGAKSITWNNDTAPSNMNDFVVAGIYDIKGEHTRIDDNLPFGNTGSGHTFHARLEVLDSSIAPGGQSDDICITQKLTLSNRVAGDGDVYIRTGRGTSKEAITWETWGMLQQNIEVGSVPTLDNLIDNGIYSGVYKYGSGQYDYETFVLVVINDYAIDGANRKISQFKYALSLTGEVSYKSRLYSIKAGEDFARWDSNWLDINEANINKTIQDAIAKVVGTAPDTLDTLQEIAAWVESHEDLYAMLKALAEDNTLNINKETERAQNAEKEIKNNAMQYNTLGVSVYADKAEIYGRSINTDVRVVEFPAATTEKAGVMSAEDKKIVDGLENGSTIVGQAREIHSRNGKTVTDSFLARTTAGSGTIGDGVATLKSVGGNIIKNKNRVSIVIGNDVSYIGNIVRATPNTNGKVQAVVNKVHNALTESVSTINGHVYYNSCYIKTNDANAEIVVGKANTDFGYISNAANLAKTTEWQYASYIATSTANSFVLHFTMGVKETTTSPLYVTKVLHVDLTEMFGAGKEPTKEECDKLFGTMDALPQGLSIANPTEFKSTGYNQADPNKVLANKGVENGVIVDKVGSNLAVVPCLPCKVGVGENNGYCIHGDFGDDIKVYLTPLNPMEVEGELYMHELTKDADKGTYVPQIKGYMLVEVPTTANLCAHFLWSEDKCERDTYEPYYESVVELPRIPEMSEYGLAGIQSSGTLACDEIDFERGVYVKRIGSMDLGTSDIRYYATGTANITYPFFVIMLYNSRNNIISTAYTTVKTTALNVKEMDEQTWFVSGRGIYLRDSRYTSVDELKSALQGVMLYYELATPEEYPLPKVDNNYISSDYGVEQFDGAVPCNANNLYYMRSLAGETRNFLDRLMAGLGTTDATALADRILAVVNPAVEPVIEEEIEL